jgi:5-formyltetrahydrofolate cyclo-ligase
MDKKTLRKQKMQERDSLSAETLQAFSDIITDKVLGLEEFKQAETILCYVSCRSEVNTRRLIESTLGTGKTVGVPRVQGDIMHFYKIRSFDDLEPGYFGILEPKPEENNLITEIENSLIIVPGLAFDRDLNRIGYGKGFYDRYFAEYADKHFIKCGIAFDMQICEKIETDQYDRPLDMLVTEKRIINA